MRPWRAGIQFISFNPGLHHGQIGDRWLTLVTHVLVGDLAIGIAR